MKVAILAMFNKLDSTYSLVNVVAEQLRMMLDAGLETKMLVCEQFEEDSKFGVYCDNRISWGKICNTLDGRQLEWHDYHQTEGDVHEAFFDEAEVVAQSLVKHLEDVDVCLLHDILYQGWHLLHNVALRQAQKQLPKTRFVSFSHSAPLIRPLHLKWPFSARYTPMPNTTYISLTYAGIAPLAKQYGVPEGWCRVVYNSLDLMTDMSEDIHHLAEKIDFFSPDILIVYPARLTPAKKFEKVAALAGALRLKSEGNVKVIFCDFPSGDIKADSYKNIIRLTGVKNGMGSEDLHFTSDYGYLNGFPRTGVLDLFSLSNIFVMPSLSEAFPLTLLEAASRGNLLVLNESVPSLAEIGKEINAYFMRWNAINFGFETTESYSPSETAYYQAHAETLLRLLREESTIRAKTKVRQRYSPQWIWGNQLGPLLRNE